MAGILIKGMEMPSCCENCRFNQFYDAKHWTTWNFCMFLDKDTDDAGNNRLADCPLVALPSHGRLIDLDAYLKASENMAEWEEYRVEEIEEYFDNCPVIVEANNG